MGAEVEKIGPPIMILAALLIETGSEEVLFDLSLSEGRELESSLA